MNQQEGRQRAIIERVYPEIDNGKYHIRRTPGESVKVSATVFADGHDVIKVLLLFRRKGEKKWQEVIMTPSLNDHWEGIFKTSELGWYEYTIEAWVDHFFSWQKGIKAKFEANQKMDVELQIGVDMLLDAKNRSTPGQKEQIDNWLEQLENRVDTASAISLFLSHEVSETMFLCADRKDAARYKSLWCEVERKKALFSTWYEVFPRSTAPEPGKHGTFKDVERILPTVAKMGFDVLYFPPIHPIGTSFRKGKDNAPQAKPDEPGSPWAIGNTDGGHKAIHKELGTLQDFTTLVKKAKEMDIDVALDIAYQCSPDHPYVKEHPDWFRWRPDGTVQYAENPPKKYQDVLPINFENDDWKNLWQELKSVFDYWIDKGVHIFRVDNPHTKSFRFWHWCITEIKKEHPDIIFLAEAFTRPRVMEQLAKVGFNQSYTYFTWRNSRWEFEQYLAELTKTEMREYFRPNFWPNTPDILPVSLQNKGEAAFIARAILAGTLSSNYGIYAPVFDFGYNMPHPMREEYINNEKYEIKHWDWEQPTRIRYFLTELNRIRRENPALQTTWNIHFAQCDNDNLLVYGKNDDEGTNPMIMAVNLDSFFTQGAWVKLPLQELGIDPNRPFWVHDQLSGHKYHWHGEWNFVELVPDKVPAHIFKVEQF